MPGRKTDVADAQWLATLANNESAGKRKSGKTRKGNAWVRRLLCEFAQAAARSRCALKLEEIYRQAARQVDKVLKGAKPADIPVQQPNEFELIVNRRVAKARGRSFPQSLLVRATNVIE